MNNAQRVDNIIKYNDAVQVIKTAILQGQYEAAKGVNRIQLTVYFAIGKYISVNTRSQAWGSHALEFISEQLRRELPGLRGFSETQMKDMRRFYEAWQMLDSNSAVATAELQNADNEVNINSTVATVELIDIHHAINIRDMSFRRTFSTYHSRTILISSLVQRNCMTDTTTYIVRQKSIFRYRN